MITHVEDRLQSLEVFVSSGVEDSERTEDPRNAEKNQHGARATQTSQVIASTDHDLCSCQQNFNINQLIDEGPRHHFPLP